LASDWLSAPARESQFSQRRENRRRDTWSSAVMMIDYEEQWLELRRLSQELAQVLAPPPRPAPDPTLEFVPEDDLSSVDAYARFAQGARAILHVE
jgi:hypothetical protein